MLSPYIEYFEFRGQEVAITVKLVDAERDVGIMSDSFEVWNIANLDGKSLDWELSSREEAIIRERIYG